MWGDLFHPHHLKLVSRILKRSENSIMEIVTKTEDKVLVEYIKCDKVWRIEIIRTTGQVSINFQEKLPKHLANDIQHVVLRHRVKDN